MTDIRLDASRWTEPRHLLDDLLPALGAPRWHGRNLDALWDGLTGDLFAVESPLAVLVANAAGSTLDRSGSLAEVAAVFAEARAELGIDCAFGTIRGGHRPPFGHRYPPAKAPVLSRLTRPR